MSASAIAAPETTVDAFLGGRVEAVQMRTGHHRAGLEAVLLSAAVAGDFAGTAVDLGSGVGVAGMALAARAANAHVVLVERDPQAAACAGEALARPANRGFAARVSLLRADIGAPEAERVAAGLGRAIAEVVLMNPPFLEQGEGTRSPNTSRADAHVLAEGGLEPWFRAAASALKPAGRLIVVFRADRLDGLLAAMRVRFGTLVILPIHPRAAEPAHRVLVAGSLGGRAPTRLLPPLALHSPAGNAYLPAVDRILRDGASLAEACPAWGP